MLGLNCRVAGRCEKVKRKSSCGNGCLSTFSAFQPLFLWRHPIFMLKKRTWDGISLKGALPPDPTFTPRERRLAQLVLLGWSTAEIADTMRLQNGSVRQLIHVLYKKMGVRNRMELALRLAEQPAILGERQRTKAPRLALHFQKSLAADKGLMDVWNKGYRERRALAKQEVRFFLRRLCKDLMSQAVKRINGRFRARDMKAVKAAKARKGRAKGSVQATVADIPQANPPTTLTESGG